jgi:phage protein U
VVVLIGDFEFNVNDTSLDNIKTNLNFRFNAQQRLGNFDNYQSSGLYDKSFEIKGKLLAKSQSQLSNFEAMAKAKLPVTFVTLDTVTTILILSLEIDKTNFLKDGAFLEQGYKIDMVEVVLD